MSAASNPPQLQLSLGHQTFKRSFTQFGLDVDDGEDSRSDSGSANASSSSLSASSSSMRAHGSASGSGSSSGTRSVSGGSSYSSPGGVDLFGYNDGERSERNKRARSEGPEREDISVSVSAASNSSAESLDVASVLSISSSDVSLDSGSSSNPSSGGQGSPQQTNASISNYNATSGFTLPVLDFGPSTPSVAEFVALRSGSSNTRTAENPPGFANMLSPRSSSPAPPPAVDIDVAMHDDDSDEDPFPSLGPSLSGRQNLGANTSMSSGFLDTARSDALLNSATERLRSAMERARTFERTLAPLRSDVVDGSVGSSSHQHSFTRPRLPPFDFESRRRTSPVRAPETPNSVVGLTNPFDRLTQLSSSTTELGGSTSEGRNLSVGGGASTDARSSLSPLSGSVRFGVDVDDEEATDIEEEEDSIIVDRELTLEPDFPDSGHSLAIDNSSSSSGSDRFSPPHSDASRISAGLDNSDASTNNRALRALSSFMSASETEDSDNVRTQSFFDSSQLDPRLSAGQTTGLRTNRPPRLELGLTSPRLSLEMSRQTDSLLSGLYGPDPPRSASRSGSGWPTGRDMLQEEEARSEANIDRFRGWPWQDLLSPPPATDLSIPGFVPRSSSEAQPRNANLQQSPRLELRPHSPFLQVPLLSSPGSSDDIESEMRRIGRMVAMDMETNNQARYTSPTRRPPPRPLYEDPIPNPLNMLRSSQSQNQAPRSSPARRPNLPTLRSAIFGPLRSSDGDALSHVANSPRRELWQTDHNDQGATQASASGVAPSMTASGLLSRVLRVDQATRRPPMPSPEGQSDRFPGAPRDLPTSIPGRRSDEEHVQSPFNSRILTDTSRAPMSSGASQTLPMFESMRALRARDREISREATERNRQFLQSWFPPIYEEERVQAAEMRTRLREMREQHRLPIPPRPLLRNRLERPAQPQAPTETLDVLRWANSWDDVLQSTATPSSLETDLFRPIRPLSDYPRTQPSTTNSISNTQSSSTEAAAYFASGPSFGPSRPTPGRFSPSVLRRRSRIFTDSDEDGMTSVPDLDMLREPWDDVETSYDSSNLYGVGREHSAPTQSIRDFPMSDPSDDLLRLLYQGPLEDVTSPQRQVNSGTNNLASAGRTTGHPNIDDLPPPGGSQISSWTSINIQRRIPTSNSSELPRRSSSVRDASRPPSLPPLQFDRLSALPDDTDSRMYGIQEPSAYRGAPWRRPQSERQADSQGNTLPRSWRSSEFAMHRTMMLRSIQARQPIRDTISGTSHGTPSTTPRSQGRTEGTQQTVNGLGSNALPRGFRYTGAYREPIQGRSNLARNDTQTHVHWGELRDESSDSRPTTNTAARPWAEPPFRRRRSLSALFAPPPDNADTIPPNRTRGAGPAGGDPHAQVHSSQPDWLEAISASRARPRPRARQARFENEPGPRPFFSRLNRSRPDLRAFGDFVRDEDFDASYESLLTLAQTLGEVKPRSTPAHVINALPTGLFKDWQGPGSDTRCPICLDDYKDDDVLLKAEPCNHWCHKECFEQWLHTAQTCPVCRTKIRPSTPQAGPSRIPRNEDMTDDSDDDYSFLSSSPNRAFFESMLPSGRPPRAPPA